MKIAFALVIVLVASIGISVRLVRRNYPPPPKPVKGVCASCGAVDRLFGLPESEYVCLGCLPGLVRRRKTR